MTHEDPARDGEDLPAADEGIEDDPLQQAALIIAGALIQADHWHSAAISWLMQYAPFVAHKAGIRAAMVVVGEEGGEPPGDDFVRVGCGNCDRYAWVPRYAVPDGAEATPVGICARCAGIAPPFDEGLASEDEGPPRDPGTDN